MASPWDLIKAKQYEAAAEAYSRLYQEQGGKANLHNRGLARLLMGDHDAALADFQLSIKSGDPRHHSTMEHLFAGVCSWYAGRPDEAVSLWWGGQAAPYADAAGGIEIPALLLYAGVRLDRPVLRQEATELLENHLERHLHRRRRREGARPRHEDFVRPGLAAWPGAVVPFLLGRMDRIGLGQAVRRAGHETLRARWRCAADFHEGLRAACEGDLEGFRDGMARCAASPCGELEHEFHLARWEVARGFPQPAFPVAG